MSGPADAAKKLALALDGAREPDGSLVLLREDYNDSTIREELAHRWQTKTDLRGSYAQTKVSQRPEFEEVNQRLRDIGYDLSPEDQATELIAKALAGDPAMKWTPEQQNAVVSAALHAAIDEMGAGVLDDMAPYDPAVKTSVEEAKQYGKESDTRAGGEAVREGIQAPGSGTREVGRERGSNLSEEPGNRPAGPGGQRGISEGRAAEGELGAFQRAPKPPASRALPGMERDIEAQRNAAAEEQGRQLTERLRAPRPPISRAAGIMERESPLFRDTDAGGQGSLFQRAIKDEETKTQNPWFLKSAKVIDAKMRGRVMSEGQPLFAKSEKEPGRADEDDAARMAREGLPLKEERPAPRETTATTGKHDIDKGIDETIDDLGKLPKRKMSASEHMDQAVDAATKGITEKTEAVKGAFAGVKGAAAGAWSTWCTPPAWSDFRQSLSDLRSAEFKAARQVDIYQKALVEVAPSERERNAITIYGEARNNT
jgi:hypothetical protein